MRGLLLGNIYIFIGERLIITCRGGYIPEHVQFVVIHFIFPTRIKMVAGNSCGWRVYYKDQTLDHLKKSE
jgi:hypothetical protein